MIICYLVIVELFRRSERNSNRDLSRNEHARASFCDHNGIPCSRSHPLEIGAFAEEARCELNRGLVPLRSQGHTILFIRILLIVTKEVERPCVPD